MATWTSWLSCSQSDTNAEKNGQVRFSYTAGSGKITIHQIQGKRKDGYLTNFYSANNKITISVGSQSKDISIYDIGFGANTQYEWTEQDGSNITDVSFTATGTQTVKITIKSWNGTSYVSNGAYWSTSINCGSSGYTLTYDANGGSGAPSSQTCTYGTAATLSSTKPTRTGYTFKYWYGAKTVPYNTVGGFNTNFKHSYVKRMWVRRTSSTKFEVIVQADNTASVQIPTWTEANNQDDIVWHKLDAGSWTRDDKTYNFGAQFSIADHKYEIINYATHAYAYNSSGTQLGSVGITRYGMPFLPGDSYYTQAANTTLYAQWKANTYTIRYNANGGSGIMADTTATYGQTTYIRKNTFTNEGYNFIGWYVKREDDQKWRYVSADGTSKGWYVEGQQPAGYVKYIYEDGVSVTTPTSVDGDILNLYAQWEAKGTENWNYGLFFIKNGDWKKGITWQRTRGVWMPAFAYAKDMPLFLTSIEITKPYTGGAIIVEEEYDLPGLEITAHYSDGSSKVVTNWTKSPEIFNNVGQLKVTISYTEDGITKTTSFGVNVWT